MIVSKKFTRLERYKKNRNLICYYIESECRGSKERQKFEASAPPMKRDVIELYV